MALQTTGAISLNDLHLEAGGTSGTECSFNDQDIRDMLGKSANAQSSFLEFYGASSKDFAYKEYVLSPKLREDGAGGPNQTITLPSNNISEGDVLVAIFYDNSGVTLNGSDIAYLSNPTGTGAKAWTTAGTYVDRWTSGTPTPYHYHNQCRIQYAIAGSTTGNSFTMYGNWQSPHTGPINSGSDEGEKYCCLMRFEASASDISHYDYESEGRSVNDSDIYQYQGSTRYINGSATPTTNTYLGIINIVAKGGQGGAYYDYTVPSGDLDNRLLVPRSYAVDERYCMYAKLQKRPSSGNYSDLTIGTGYGWQVAWNYSHCYLRIHS